MLEALPLLATTFLFISIFLYIFSTVQLHDIRTHWNERRCEALVMLIAQSIPDPNDPNVDPASFAADNFSFCINKIIDGTLSLAIGPVFAIFSKQLDVTQPIAAVLNTLKGSASNIVMNPFNSYMNILWKKFRFILYHASHVFMRMSSAFHRIFGIVISTIFAGISMYKGIINIKNFMMKICVIILYIIIALLFLLFIPLIQVIPIVIVPLLTALVVAGVKIEGADAFNCVAPGTLVACKDGWKAVESLKIGESLREGRVTGILKGIPGGACVKIGEVVISNLHVIFDKKVGKWVHASDHSMAVPHPAPEIVYCLTTSTRTWIVEGDLLLRDWMDIPNTPEASDTMEDFVWTVLNGFSDNDSDVSSRTSSSDTTDEGPPQSNPVHLPVVMTTSHIFHKHDGYISILNVKLHDMIYDGESFTEVLGIYEGMSPSQKAGCEDVSWILNQTRNRWVHPILKSDSPSYGYNLITRSGKYSMNGDIRRDLTEIGCDRLYETRRLVLSLLNSRNDEEECNFA